MAAIRSKEGGFFRGSDSTFLQLVVAPGMVACDLRRSSGRRFSPPGWRSEKRRLEKICVRRLERRLDHTSAIRDQGYVYTLPDSFCAGTKTLPNRASVYI